MGGGGLPDLGGGGSSFLDDYIIPGMAWPLFSSPGYGCLGMQTEVSYRTLGLQGLLRTPRALKCG